MLVIMFNTIIFSLGKKYCVLVVLRNHINYPLLVSDMHHSHNCFSCDNQFKSSDCLIIQKDSCFSGSHKFVPEERTFNVVISIGGLRKFMISYETHLFLNLCKTEELIFMIVVWMWNVKYKARFFTILFLLYFLDTFNLAHYKFLPSFIHTDNSSLV